jgi:hypothetical protein
LRAALCICYSFFFVPVAFRLRGCVRPRARGAGNEWKGRLGRVERQWGRGEENKARI